MRNTLKGVALSLGILGTASIALADDATSPGQEIHQPGSMMQDDSMKGGDGMSGMMGMMKMMQQMEPMMERCNEMMAAMTEHMKSMPHDTGAPKEKG
ncbi:hypothetical protein P7L75_23180 [Tistrella mobilis]|uniref:hypothetical protein n=1 Tax=Tistrella mobilis TaxID=171437 RepID=UPI003555EDA2